MEHGELEFEHYLAERLGMTVARLRRELSQEEYMRWGVYFARKGQRAQLAQRRGARRARP